MATTMASGTFSTATNSVDGSAAAVSAVKRPLPQPSSTSSRSKPGNSVRHLPRRRSGSGMSTAAGAEYGGSFAYENGTLTMEIAGAYGIDALRSCRRAIAFDPNGITLTDTFDYSGKQITERFVTKREPKVEKGRIKIGKTCLIFDPALAPALTEETHYLHGYDESHIPVYCIDFALTKGEKTFNLRVETER